VTQANTADRSSCSSTIPSIPLPGRAPRSKNGDTWLKTQAIVKQACQRAGIDIELKSVTPSVYFSSDAANPDTARKFYADIQMLTTGVGAPPDPEGLMRQFLSSEIAAKENKWQRGNATRWHNEAYDNLFSCRRRKT
jgi:peptide/nickel transport system substrate-binding protein